MKPVGRGDRTPRGGDAGAVTTSGKKGAAKEKPRGAAEVPLPPQQPILRPKAPVTPLEAAERLIEQGRRHEALAQLEQAALGRGPHTGDCLALAARVAAEIDGHDGRAADLLERAQRNGAAAPALDAARLELHVAREESDLALALVTRLLAARPKESRLHAIRSQLLIAGAEPAEGKRAAEKALATARTVRERSAANVRLAEACFRLGDVEAARRLCREALVIDPDDVAARLRLCELVLPNFDAPDRDTVVRLVHDAGEAYSAGRWDEALRLAALALKHDPDEGLAHRLYATAQSRIEERRDRGGVDRAVLPPLATEEERTALVEHLSRVVARAVLPDGTPATVERLFPDWRQLSPLQRASVAAAALAYGKILPLAIQAGAVYRLVPPGVSAVSVDPDKRHDHQNAFGRYHWAIRGWQRQGFVVTGTERIDGAIVGERNTVAHELAHVLHWVMRLAKTAERPTELQRRLAALEPRIAELYAEAKRGKNGQRLLDSYSGNNDREYFAQGVMSYVNPHGMGKENARRLKERNPHLFELVREIVQLVEDMPALVPLVGH